MSDFYEHARRPPRFLPQRSQRAQRIRPHARRRARVYRHHHRAAAIRFTGWRQIDPWLSILIALLIVWTAWDIIRESLNILLEGLPRGLSLSDVIAAMRGVEGVLDVHDLHIWSLGSSTRALSCHATISDIPASASDVVLRRLNEVLAERFHIFHSTVQFEHLSCAISESGCAIPVSAEGHEGHEAHQH
jgi:cobalt-zinc-cadmium efflux system protein